jgi:signal transduction histidine kinase
MTVPLVDPATQTTLVGIFVNVAGSATAYYLWTEHRSDRFLLFWMASWLLNGVRWLVHYGGQSDPALTLLEAPIGAVSHLCLVLGCYQLLPARTWKQTDVIAVTASIFVAWGAAGYVMHKPVEMVYSLFAIVLLFCAGCMWRAYRASGLSGYAFAAATFAYQFTFVVVGLAYLGGQVSSIILGPLVYHTALTLSLVVIAYQRNRQRLLDSEQTLQKIFDTVPVPVIITRPPLGEIERANAAARAQMSIAADEPLGRKTSEDYGARVDVGPRRQIYADLQSGMSVMARELGMIVRGEPRTLVVNAARIELAAGKRYILASFDITDLRRAESEVRASAEQMRQLYVKLGTVEDDERRALHRELHDRVGANLSSLVLQMDLIGGMLEHGDVAGARGNTRDARETAVETIAIARDLMAELRPPALDELGLVAALRAHAESQGGRLHLPIEIIGEDLSPRLDIFVEGALFRIAQEALVNVAKHARAPRARISVEAAQDSVTMTISDDGTGFDAGAPPADGRAHWGLTTIRERARAIDATLRIDTALGQGTRIVVRTPRTNP